ncbi:MAG: DUF2095 family protein [Candidatus Hodarchaeota archaeon]
MRKKPKEKKNTLKEPKINDFEGLHINYETSELEKQFPNLMSEISNRKKALRINSVNLNVEDNDDAKDMGLKGTIDYQEDLKNPGVIDFIRRCSSQNEAFEILDFLLKRKEISNEEYKKIKNRIKKKNGLKKLIEKYGGFKKPGYYERKFYSKNV